MSMQRKINGMIFAFAYKIAGSQSLGCVFDHMMHIGRDFWQLSAISESFSCLSVVQSELKWWHTDWLTLVDPRWIINTRIDQITWSSSIKQTWPLMKKWSMSCVVCCVGRRDWAPHLVEPCLNLRLKSLTWNRNGTGYGDSRHSWTTGALIDN